MEFCEGSDAIFKMLKRKGSLSEREACSIMRQILLAIELLHLNDIVHRDIKLDNVVCCYDPNVDGGLAVKVCDFGFSQKIREYETMTSSVGTPQYWAPEIFSGPRGYGPEVDIFAAGVVAYCLLSGNFPFHGSSENELMANIKRGAVDFDSRPWPCVSEHGRSFVKAMLQREPRKRLSAAAALRHPWFVQENLWSEESLGGTVELSGILADDQRDWSRKLKTAVHTISFLEKLRRPLLHP